MLRLLLALLFSGLAPAWGQGLSTATPGTLAPAQHQSAPQEHRRPAASSTPSQPGTLLGSAPRPGPAAGALAGTLAGNRPAPENTAVADAVGAYLRQFDGACFARVARIGDANRYREALGQHLTIRIQGKAGAKDLVANYEGRLAGDPVLHLSFALQSRTPRGPEQKALTQEALRHIHWLHGARVGQIAPGADYTPEYLGLMADLLRSWQRVEHQLMEGEQTPEAAQVRFRQMENAARAIEARYQPDLAQLEARSGFRVRMADIRALYLSGACGEGPKRMVMAANFLRAHPETEQLPSDLPGQPPPAPELATGGNHQVYAMIFDREDRPLAGALFTVLRPGVTTQSWEESRFERGLVVAQGVSGDTGRATLDKPLTRGKRYAFVVSRDGYRTVRFESLEISSTSPEPLRISVKLGK